MRTLKRTLSLVLCIVMVLGLCVFSFDVSAKTIDDYPDNGDIQYREAVQLLSQLGIINGRSTGDQGFDPKANLTRAEGATIIVRLLGINNPIGTSSFNDVEEFYQPFVAYLENMKIVAGYGDGRFGQGDPLTGSAFAKMLACAIGYRASAEGLLGSQWEIGTAKLIKKLSLDDGMVGFDQTRAITREEAAQIALNGLQARMVEYEGKDSDTITFASGDSISLGGDSKSKDMTSSSGYAQNIKKEKDSDGKYYVEFGEDHFRDLKKQEDQIDDLGRPSNKWTLKGTEICNEAKTPVAVFTDKASADDIAAKLSGYKFFGSENSTSVADAKSIDINNNSNNKHSNTTYFLAKKYKGNNSIVIGGNTYSDGDMYPVVKACYFVDGGSGYKAENDSEHMLSAEVGNKNRTPADYIKENGLANGMRVEFYAENDYITDIVILAYDAAKVTNINTASNGDVTYNFGSSTGYNGRTSDHIGTRHTYVATNSKDDIVINGAIAKNDYVTFVKGTEKVHVYPCTSFTGRQTSNNGNDKITVDGTTYTLQFRQDGAASKKYVNSTSNANYYRDQYGFVVHTDNAELNITDYAVVDRIAIVTSGTVQREVYAEANLVFTDGSMHTVKVTGIRPKGSTSFVDFTELDGDGYVRTMTDRINWAYDDSVAVRNTRGNMTMSHLTEKNKGVYSQMIVAYERDNGNFKLNYDIDTGSTHVRSGSNIVTKGAALVGTNGSDVYGTNSTVYIVRTKTENKPKFAAYVGYNSVPTSKAISVYGVDVPYLRKNDNIALIYVDAIDEVASADKDNDKLFYFTTKDASLYGTSNDNGYSYIEGILDGKFVTGDQAIRAKHSDHDRLKAIAEANEKGFALIGFDTDGYIDFEEVKPIYEDVDGVQEEKYVSGRVSDKTLNNLNVGLDGYVLQSSSKVYVIDGSNVTEETIDSAQLNDRYMIKLKGTGSADRLKIDILYLVRTDSEVYSKAEASQISQALHDHDYVVVDSLEMNQELTVPSGKTLIVKSGIEGNKRLTIDGSVWLDSGRLTRDEYLDIMDDLSELSAVYGADFTRLFTANQLERLYLAHGVSAPVTVSDRGEIKTLDSNDVFFLDDALSDEDLRILGDASFGGNVYVFGEAWFLGNINITGELDIFTPQNKVFYGTEKTQVDSVWDMYGGHDIGQIVQKNPSTLTVTYYENESDRKAGKAYDTISVKSGRAFNIAEAPNVANAYFNGWRISEDRLIPAGTRLDNGVTADTVLVGEWTKNVTFRFHSGDGESAVAHTQTIKGEEIWKYENGDIIDIRLDTVPVGDDTHILKGWSRAYGSQQVFEAGESLDPGLLSVYAVEGGNIDLYPVWY